MLAEVPGYLCGVCVGVGFLLVLWFPLTVQKHTLQVDWSIILAHGV